MMFVSWLAQSVAPPTIAVYLAAVRSSTSMLACLIRLRRSFLAYGMSGAGSPSALGL